MEKHKFIINKQVWDYDDGYTEIATMIMEEHGDAFVGVWTPEFGNESYVCNLFVKDSKRKSGLATEILDYAEGLWQKEMKYRVEVECDSPQWLRDWYEKRGYKVVVRKSNKENNEQL